MKIRIGTLNCQNNEENRNNSRNANVLANHIIDKKYDILGTQEVTINFTNNLLKYLDNYSLYGKFQYGKGIIGTKIKIIKDYNQANQIITHYKVNNVRTYTLPWIPYTYKDLVRGLKKKSITKRMVTVIETIINNNKVYILNAHLDYYIPNIQNKQLEYLLKRINKLKEYGNIILMGDFNLDLSNDKFNNFICELDKIGINRVPIKEKTNASKYKEESSIDHIFISSEFKILEYGIFDDISDITDHKAIYVDVDI